MRRTSVGQPLCFWNSVSDVCTGFNWREGSTGTCWWGLGVGWESLCGPSPSTLSSATSLTADVQRHTKCAHGRAGLTWPVQKTSCWVDNCFAIQSNPLHKTRTFRLIVLLSLLRIFQENVKPPPSRKIKGVKVYNQMTGKNFLSHLPESSKKIGTGGPSLGINTWNESWLMIRNGCKTHKFWKRFIQEIGEVCCWIFSVVSFEEYA